VGVGIGGDGRLYVTSLYLAGNVASPYCHSDLIVLTSARSGQGAGFEPYDPVKVSPERLWSELAGPSWQRRQWAHQEILRRGGALLEEAADRLAGLIDSGGGRGESKELETTRTQFNHLIWLTSAARNERALALLRRLAEETNPDTRWQALRALAQFAGSAGSAWQPAQRPEGPAVNLAGDLQAMFARALADSDARVRLTALTFFIETTAELPVAAIAAAGNSDDTYLRQTAARLLAQRALLADLNSLMTASDAGMRIVGTLAAGMRLTVPSTYAAPPQNLPLFLPTEGAFFKTRLPFADVAQPVDLSAAGPSGSYTMAQLWKTGRHSPEQEELFSLLLHTLNDADRSVRLQAAYFLSLLRDTRSEAPIERTRVDVLVRDLEPAPVTSVEQVWFVGPFADGGQPATKLLLPEEGAVDLTARYGNRAWNVLAARDGEFSLAVATEPASSFAFLRLQSAARQNGLVRLKAGTVAALWQNGRRLTPVDPGSRIEKSSTWLLDLQPGSNDLLIRLRHAASPGAVALRFHAAQGLTATLPEMLDANLLTERLRSAKETDGQVIPPEFIDVDWTSRARTGDVERGRRLFGSLGCVKCHAIAADQKSGGAPSLAECRRRFTVAHLVESVLLPSKQVAETFRATSIVTKSGQTVSGLVIADDGEQIELLLPDATRRTIPRAEIDESQKSATSPMPAGLVKTVEELQHLLAYLLSENPSPP
jgi:putative heme-binding domain-containing protein